MQTVLDQLTGREIYDSLIRIMTREFEDFADAQKQYEYAMATLQTELGADAVTDAMEAIQQQAVSNLLFAGALGIKANLNNFINPLARNFLDVDSEIYLREDTSHGLPNYEQAQTVLVRFYARYSPDQQMLYADAVIAYIYHLKTVAPKLAHYCGSYWATNFFPASFRGIMRMRR